MALNHPANGRWYLYIGHSFDLGWSRSEEIAVDTRGNIYLNDDKWGTFVLRYTGNVPAKAASKTATK
jgi:hypothetical protein